MRKKGGARVWGKKAGARARRKVRASGPEAQETAAANGKRSWIGGGVIDRGELKDFRFGGCGLVGFASRQIEWRCSDARESASRQTRHVRRSERAAPTWLEPDSEGTRQDEMFR